MKTVKMYLLGISFIIGMNLCLGQGVKPLLKLSNTSNKEAKAFIAPANKPSCPRIPSLFEVNTGQWTFSDHFYTANQAIKLGIPIVNITGSHELKVYVKDYRRSASCTTKDSSATILYGQVIRTVIEIENYDASVGIDLAAIAANGTLKRNTQHFYFYKDGFYNEKIDSILALVQGKVFDVENYALYQSVMTEMIKLLKDPKTIFSVNQIGIIEPLDWDYNLLSQSPIVAYTLMNIKRGKSCNKTKSKFLNSDINAIEIVEGVYRSIGLVRLDDKPTDEAKLKAKKYLQNVKIRR